MGRGQGRSVRRIQGPPTPAPKRGRLRLTVLNTARIDVHRYGLPILSQGGQSHRFTDSLSCMVLLKSLQRRDFPLWLYRHLVLQLLIQTVRLMNARADAGVVTRLVNHTEGSRFMKQLKHSRPTQPSSTHTVPWISIQKLSTFTIKTHQWRGLATARPPGDLVQS